MKIQAEIVNGICPTCDEYTPLVGVTKQFYRCLTCGTDLEQKVNGVISYIPHLTKQTLQSDGRKIFRWRSVSLQTLYHVQNLVNVQVDTQKTSINLRKRSYKKYNRQGR